ncbi:hypothetical protein B5F10_04660 [Anaerotruncus colihominis]|uniref:Uncharacterized protein n=1 Tax=Anaerotruncus colihominis TaxID=169435 RepID=A0A1Y4N659_9FIRM|nr:hypothetical protein B5F11_00215 [Anaerotruncus colihominis]OUP75521.1 hypothetical protein B5F10_04660 [Anaerotruncus colihominis]
MYIETFWKMQTSFVLKCGQFFGQIGRIYIFQSEDGIILRRNRQRYQVNKFSQFLWLCLWINLSNNRGAIFIRN